MKNTNSLNEKEPRPLRDYLYQTPNKLSEELIRCMVTIYCTLSDPPLEHLGAPESPSSTRSSSTTLSSILGILSDGWSPGHKKGEYSYDASLVDPFQVKGKSGVSGTYRHMVEVPWISVFSRSLFLGEIKMPRIYRIMCRERKRGRERDRV